jgi:hypothetical protein
MEKEGTRERGLQLVWKNAAPKASRKKYRANLRIVSGQERHAYDRWLNWKPKGPPEQVA